MSATETKRCGLCRNWEPLQHTGGRLGHCGVLVLVPASVLVEYGGSKRPWEGAACSHFGRKDVRDGG